MILWSGCSSSEPSSSSAASLTVCNLACWPGKEIPTPETPLGLGARWVGDSVIPSLVGLHQEWHQEIGLTLRLLSWWLGHSSMQAISTFRCLLLILGDLHPFCAPKILLVVFFLAVDITSENLHTLAKWELLFHISVASIQLPSGNIYSSDKMTSISSNFCHGIIELVHFM